MNNQPLHPGRYPKHDDPFKGQVYEGQCNRTACSSFDAVHWNVLTFGFYCHHCAKGINYHPSRILCIFVNEKPNSIELMDSLSLGHLQNIGESAQ